MANHNVCAQVGALVNDLDALFGDGFSSTPDSFAEEFFANGDRSLFYLPPASPKPDHRLRNFICVVLFLGILFGVEIGAILLKIGI